jgi:demethylmenaquinone methyltransferase / 2-methoxy-6-polyprenyl-1,4-benzoquinol methylase
MAEIDKNKADMVHQLFSKIAFNYDFLNHLLSLNIDKMWRRKAIDKLHELVNKPVRVLDLCAGTLDLSINLAERSSDKLVITASDFCQPMLDIGIKKLQKKKINSVMVLKEDATKLSFAVSTFDVSMVAFGIRNVNSITACLSEMFRVTKPGGAIIILDFSEPTLIGIKQLYQVYFSFILPIIGRLFSKSYDSYSYLPNSVKMFPKRQQFINLMEEAGFVACDYKDMSMGIVSLYWGRVGRRDEN